MTHANHCFMRLHARPSSPMYLHPFHSVHLLFFAFISNTSFDHSMEVEMCFLKLNTPSFKKKKGTLLGDCNKINKNSCYEVKQGMHVDQRVNESPHAVL